jgi:hypothetical protein
VSIAHVFPAVAPVLVAIADVLPAVAHILATIANAALVLRVAAIFAPVADVFTVVPHVLPAIANVLPAVAPILATVRPVFDLIGVSGARGRLRPGGERGDQRQPQNDCSNSCTHWHLLVAALAGSDFESEDSTDPTCTTARRAAPLGVPLGVVATPTVLHTVRSRRQRVARHKRRRASRNNKGARKGAFVARAEAWSL